jgi:hypothetical protein
MQTAEPLTPEPSSFEVEITIEKLQRYKSPHINQIPTELIQAGGNTLHSKIHKLGIRKNCHSNGRHLLLYLFLERAMKLTIVITQGYHCYKLHTEFYPVFLSQSLLHT